MNHNPNSRFMWNVGSIQTEFSDVPEEPLCLWDRQAKQPVLTLYPPYHNLFCLETTEQGPLTAIEEWVNALCNEDLQSEDIPPTDESKYD